MAGAGVLGRSGAGATAGPGPRDDAGDLLAGLDPSQRAAVTATARPLGILAGAGAGKTRVLTRRIAWESASGRVDLDRVLAVTFTRKAAGELVRRLEHLPGGGRVTAGTFHALALAQLRRRWRDRGRYAPTVLERKARLLAPMLGRGADGRTRASDVATEIEWAKARMIEPEDYAGAAARAGRRPSTPLADVAGVYDQYEQQKHRRRLVDFDDLIWWCVRALEGDSDFAAAQRFRFRHLYVDEFQDVTPVQLRLVRAWLGDRDDLCVVGDPDQAIYRFAGAEPELLAHFEDHFPGATVIRLERNYRSTPQIVAAARAALAPAPCAARNLTVIPGGPPPTLTEHATDTAEAAAVARALRDAHASGRPWSTMAVLYRTNAQSVLFEEALARADIPARVRGTSRFLDRPEVVAVLETLTTNAREVPGRPFAEHLVDLREDAATMADEQREHAAALVALGTEYLAHDGERGTVDGFLAWLTATLRSEGGEIETADAVDLLTFHRAKGLEYETVFVCGLEHGLVPITHASTPAELADERRLLYVAMSRAAHTLHLSWASERMLGGRAARREPSPWLREISAASAMEDTQSRGRPARPPEALRDARARLGRPAPATRTRPRRARGIEPEDRALFESLLDWRRGVARAAAVPEYVVMPDRTLHAVAARRPTSPAALAALPGIGAARLERYGGAILGLVARSDGS
jgi:ATP-dependent DNA helicase UvrD/PcrA